MVLVQCRAGWTRHLGAALKHCKHGLPTQHSQVDSAVKHNLDIRISNADSLRIHERLPGKDADQDASALTQELWVGVFVKL
jgi:hypothetical protein